MTGRCPPADLLPLANDSDHLEAVQFGHVDVQEQQVEGALFGQGRGPRGRRVASRRCAPPAQEVIDELLVELVVLGHQDAQRRRGRDRFGGDGAGPPRRRAGRAAASPRRAGSITR